MPTRCARRSRARRRSSAGEALIAGAGDACYHSAVNAPEKPRRAREGETLVYRQAGDPAKLRRAIAKVLAHRSKQKPTSVLRELAELRARKYR